MTPQEALQDAVLQIARQQERRYYGKFRGVVTDNDDPDRQGRVRAQVPALFGDEPCGWAAPSAPYSGQGKGFLALPEVDDNVWIEFEGGDPSHPIWSGCWWGVSGAPPQAGPEVKVWQTASGHKITLDDTAGGEKVVIEDKNGATITLSQTGIELKKGGMKVVLSDSEVSINDGALTIR